MCDMSVHGVNVYIRGGLVRAWTPVLMGEWRKERGCGKLTCE